MSVCRRNGSKPDSPWKQRTPSMFRSLRLQPETRKPMRWSTSAALAPSTPNPMMPTEIAAAGHWTFGAQRFSRC